MWARIWSLLDWCFFGPLSTGPNTFGLLIRILRYPYAVIRDLWRGDINLRAMGLVYTTLLSVIPLVAIAFVIFKIFGAHRELEPILYEFFAPLGSAAANELAMRVVEFADRVSSGVVGSVGFATLAYTLIGTIKRVEDSFNFVWHVEHPRRLARRIVEYLILIVVGPLLLVVFIGLTRTAFETTALQEVAKLHILRHAAIAVAPTAMVTVFFTGMYMLVPNTRVHWRSALIGAVVGGVLWAAVGKIFTAFVIYSTKLQFVYAGFAFMVAALLWTYLAWLILLAGAQLSFYIQNPIYLRHGLREVRLSCTEVEHLALRVMYYVGRAHLNGHGHWTIRRLTPELGVPGIEIARLVEKLERTKLMVVTGHDELVPARDIGQITASEILDVARELGSGDLASRKVVIPSVDRLLAAIEETRRGRCGNLTLRDLVQEAPRPALTLAVRHD